MAYEYPPILSGSERQQIAALRDYLVRMARELESAAGETETAGSAATDTALRPGARKAAAGTGAGDSTALRSLIVKTADRVQKNVDSLTAALSADYMAKSDFGSYAEQLTASFTATARQVVESYDFQSQLEAVNALYGGLDSHMSAIRGEIRRGLITDPDSGETAFGIAISESLSLTGATQTENGLIYYELSPGQTLGLYTATGWQFWINGSKKGWFDSADGMLHVGNIVVEDALQLGADWTVTTYGGFGIRYVGE